MYCDMVSPEMALPCPRKGCTEVKAGNGRNYTGCDRLAAVLTDFYMVRGGKMPFSAAVRYWPQVPTPEVCTMRHAIKSGLSLLLVMTALAAAPAMARDHGRGHDRDYDRDRYGYQDRDRDHDRRGYDRYDDRRRGHDRDYGYHRDGRYYRDDRYYRPAPRVVYRPVYRPAYHPGYGGPPRWARGARYYGDGYGPTYVVRDYRGYGLRAPPRGYYWRRSDVGDFLLVAAATGIIADLILHH
jgi:Ni/Co efflux regulator RcnB